MKQFLLARLSPIYGPPNLKIIMFPLSKLIWNYMQCLFLLDSSKTIELTLQGIGFEMNSPLRVFPVTFNFQCT